MVAAPTRTHNTPVDSPQGSIEGMMLILQQQQPTASSSYLVGCRLEESSGSGYIPSFGGATLDMPEAKSRQGCNHVAPVAECGSRTDMCLSLGEGHSLGCINSSGIDGTMRREDFGQQQVRMPLDDDDLLRQDFEDFEVGSEPLKRGFSDTIYDFDVPLSSLPNFTAVQASPQEEKLNFEELMISGSTAELGRTCPLAKEETFSSLELSEESDENKMFVRGEGTPDTSIAS